MVEMDVLIGLDVVMPQVIEKHQALVLLGLQHACAMNKRLELVPERTQAQPLDSLCAIDADSAPFAAVSVDVEPYFKSLEAFLLVLFGELPRGGGAGPLHLGIACTGRHSVGQLRTCGAVRRELKEVFEKIRPHVNRFVSLARVILGRAAALAHAAKAWREAEEPRFGSLEGEKRKEDTPDHFVRVAAGVNGRARESISVAVTPLFLWEEGGEEWE
eukprot:scaffold71051_cov27-Tisochrysis_lutea.AAC.1